MNDDATRAVIDKLGEQPGETPTPERVEAIQTAMHEDLGRFINTIGVRCRHSVLSPLLVSDSTDVLTSYPYESKMGG